MPSSEIFQNPGVTHFIAAIPARRWAHAAPPAASQNRVIPLIWLQISPCAYAPRTRVLLRHNVWRCRVNVTLTLDADSEPRSTAQAGGILLAELLCKNDRF